MGNIYNYHKKLTLTFLLMLVTSIIVTAQIPNGKITGKVTTSDGRPAPYVTVIIKELNKVTSTNDNGSYTIRDIKPGTYTITISEIGAQSNEKTVTVISGKATVTNFTISQSAAQLAVVNINCAKTINTTKISIGKANLSPLDLPQSGGIVTSQVIEDQQVNRVGDAVRNVSGVTLTQTRGGVSETFSARGYIIGAGGGSGSIFKNGVLTNTAGFTEASALESIEVLKGTSALQYGNVSGGLIINLITRKPKFENGGSVSMRYGSYNFYKPLVDIYGPINNNLAFRVVSTYENSGSYRNGVKTERAYVNPSLLYKLGDNTTIFLEGDYLKSNLTPDWGLGTLNNGQQIPDVPRSQFINTAWAYSHMDQFSGSLTVNHKLNDAWHINFIGSAQGTKIDSYGSSLPNIVSANGDWSRGVVRANTTENNYTAQVNLNGKFKTGSINHQLLAGSDFANVVNLTNAYTYPTLTGGVYDVINIVDLNKYTQRTDIPNVKDTTLTKAPVNRFGAYAQDLISLTDQFKVLAGLRYSVQRIEQTYITDVATQVVSRPVGTSVVATKFDRAFSPKVALIYQPIKTTSIYATYSNNFIVNTGTDIATGGGIAPSIVNQYEIGSKNELFNGKLSANVSIYRIVNSNLAVMAPYQADGVTANTVTTVKQLNGETTSDGFEVDITGNLSKNFYFITGYAYNNMRYTNTSGLKGSVIEGETVVNNPHNTVNASLFYTFDGSTLHGLKLGASSFYTGSRLGGYNNTVGQSQAYSRLLPLSGFATVDLSAGYTYKKLSLLASVTNITNTNNYLIHDNYSITPIPPTQFFTTLTYKF